MDFKTHQKGLYIDPTSGAVIKGKNNNTNLTFEHLIDDTFVLDMYGGAQRIPAGTQNINIAGNTAIEIPANMKTYQDGGSAGQEEQVMQLIQMYCQIAGQGDPQCQQEIVKAIQESEDPSKILQQISTTVQQAMQEQEGAPAQETMEEDGMMRVGGDIDMLYQKMKAGGMACNPKKKKGGELDENSFALYLMQEGGGAPSNLGQAQYSPYQIDPQYTGAAMQMKMAEMMKQQQLSQQAQNNPYGYQLPEVSITGDAPSGYITPSPQVNVNRGQQRTASAVDPRNQFMPRPTSTPSTSRPTSTSVPTPAQTSARPQYNPKFKSNPENTYYNVDGFELKVPEGMGSNWYTANEHDRYENPRIKPSGITDKQAFEADYYNRNNVVATSRQEKVNNAPALSIPNMRTPKNLGTGFYPKKAATTTPSPRNNTPVTKAQMRPQVPAPQIGKYNPTYSPQAPGAPVYGAPAPVSPFDASNLTNVHGNTYYHGKYPDQAPYQREGDEVWQGDGTVSNPSVSGYVGNYQDENGNMTGDQVWDDNQTQNNYNPYAQYMGGKMMGRLLGNKGAAGLSLLSGMGGMGSLFGGRSKLKMNLGVPGGDRWDLKAKGNPADIIANKVKFDYGGGYNTGDFKYTYYDQAEGIADAGNTFAFQSGINDGITQNNIQDYRDTFYNRDTVSRGGHPAMDASKTQYNAGVGTTNYAGMISPYASSQPGNFAPGNYAPSYLNQSKMGGNVLDQYEDGSEVDLNDMSPEEREQFILSIYRAGGSVEYIR